MKCIPDRDEYLIFMQLVSLCLRWKESSWGPCCCVGSRFRGCCLHALQEDTVYSAQQESK